MTSDGVAKKCTQYLIFSTLQEVREISGVRYTKVGAFDAKVKNEGLIRGMSIRNAFVSLGSFMENFQGQPFLAPRFGWRWDAGYERTYFVNNEDAVA